MAPPAAALLLTLRGGVGTGGVIDIIGTTDIIDIIDTIGIIDIIGSLDTISIICSLGWGGCCDGLRVGRECGLAGVGFAHGRLYRACR